MQSNQLRSLIAPALSIIIFVFSLTYVAAYCAHIYMTAPETYRADYLNHLLQIVHWDNEKKYGKFVGFVFEFQSGHIIAIQKTFSLINFYLFHSSAKISKLFGLLVIALYWVVHARAFLRSGTQPAVMLALFTFSLMVFSPHALEVYTWTDSIPAHYPTAIFALFALTSANRLLTEKSNNRWRALLILLFAALSILTNGSGWAVLPALLVLFFIHHIKKMYELPGRPNRTTVTASALAFGASLIAIAAWVLSHANAGQRLPNFHGYESALLDPAGLLKYFFAVIVSPWLQLNILSIWGAGIAIATISGRLIYQCIRAGTYQSLTWATYSIFGLISCGLIALTRFNRELYEFGIVSSRYSIYALPIYAGILGMAISTKPNLTKEKAWLGTEKIFNLIVLLAAVPAFYFFAISSLQAYKREVSQNKEVEGAHRGTMYWNLKSALRLFSSYELPQLYLETLPSLKAKGRATAITRDFIPAGGTDKNVDVALNLFAASRYTDATQIASCGEEPDASIKLVEEDERFIPRIRHLGTAFIRLVGYARDRTDCDLSLDYIIAISKDGHPICTSRSGVYVWSDLPEEIRDHGIMSSQFAFDFSCPIPHGPETLFPIQLLGYSPKTGKLILIGKSSHAASPPKSRIGVQNILLRRQQNFEPE